MLTLVHAGQSSTNSGLKEALGLSRLLNRILRAIRIIRIIRAIRIIRTIRAGRGRARLAGTGRDRQGAADRRKHVKICTSPLPTPPVPLALGCFKASWST